MILNEQGLLNSTSVSTDDTSAGWAARMRDRIRPLLERVADLRTAFEAAQRAAVVTLDETGSAEAALDARESALDDAWEIAHALGHDLLTDDMRNDPVAMLCVMNGIVRSLMAQINRADQP